MSRDQRLLNWVAANHPEYAGWRLRSMAWEYDVSTLRSEIANRAEEVHDRRGEICADDFSDLIERVQPPAGYMYVTVQKDDVRVGINVPCAAI